MNKTLAVDMLGKLRVGITNHPTDDRQSPAAILVYPVYD